MRTITIVASTISRAKRRGAVVIAEYTPTLTVQIDKGQVAYWRKTGVWCPKEEDAAQVAADDLDHLSSNLEAAATFHGYAKREC